METIEEVKDYLDALIEEDTSSHLKESYYLAKSKLSDEDCQLVEKELTIVLPNSYKELLLTYDWTNFELGYLSFLGDSIELIKTNKVAVNPFYEFYKEIHLLEMGSYEADPICIRLNDQHGSTGEIVYIDHELYPDLKADFICRDFERLIVCAAINLRFKKEAGFNLLDASQKDLLNNQIMKAILNIEPRANETSFWDNLLRSF